MRAPDDRARPDRVLSVRQRIVIVLCLAMAAVGLWASPAAAIDASATFYTVKWPSGSRPVVYFDDGSPDPKGKATPGFPHLETWRFRMDNAIAEVNKWGTATSPVLSRATGSSSYGKFGKYFEPCNLSRTGVFFYASLAAQGNPAGATWKCALYPPEHPLVTKFGVVFNSNLSFYSGSGTAPADKWDLWSAATHELVHATGWTGHWDLDGFAGLCSGARGDDPTMCSYQLAGETHARTLEFNDIDTMQGAY
jgi:hypothetical protein